MSAPQDKTGRMKEWIQPSFEQAKADFLRIARAVEKAQSAPELRALLMSDIGAEHHSFSTLELIERASILTCELLHSMEDDLDQQGVPA